MMSTALPLFYFRPTVAWVDDDSIFLEAVNLSFKKHYNCLNFNNPQKALDFFNTYQSPLSRVSFKREFTESDLFGINHHYPVDLKMASIKNLFDQPDKQQEIAVLVIDYNMPNTNGLEICKQLKTHPIKKILLTGEATEEKAIEAFNQGLIDKFIKKEVNITEKLEQYLSELIYQYFSERGINIISHLEAARPSPLTDPIFVNFFNDWRHKNGIEEFYLINKQGSYLAKDKTGNLSYFILMSEQDKTEFLKLNDEMTDDNLPILSLLADGKVIPFFGIEKEYWDIDIKEWKNYFYPAQHLSGREKYYWTVINN